MRLFLSYIQLKLYICSSYSCMSYIQREILKFRAWNPEFLLNNSFHFSEQRRMLWILRLNTEFLGTQASSTDLKKERVDIKGTLCPTVLYVLPIKNIWLHNILPDQYWVTQMSMLVGKRLVLCLLLQVMTYLSLLRAFDMLKLLKLHKSIDFRTILRVSRALEPTQADLTHYGPEKWAKKQLPNHLPTGKWFEKTRSTHFLSMDPIYSQM